MEKEVITRVLFVSGDDYSALTAEREVGIPKLTKMVKNSEELPDGIEAEILEFKGAIDPEFVQFLFDRMIDYDFAKGTCFYVLSDERRFEFVEGNSSKFWSISKVGSSVTTQWGKIGTDGQNKTKEFNDDAMAQKEYDKLVKEKTNKGYVEV